MYNVLNCRKGSIILKNPLRIENRKLVEIPNLFFKLYPCKEYDLLELNFQNVEILRHLILAKFKNLKSLTLRLNNLSAIDSNLFNTLTKLRIIHLEANSLTLIPKKLFYKLKLLENVTLIVRHVVFLPGKLFNRNKLLNYLVLDGISVIQAEFLQNIRRVHVLHITLSLDLTLFFNIKKEFSKQFQYVDNFKMNRVQLTNYDIINTLTLTRLTVFHSVVNALCLNNFLKIPMLKYANLSNNFELNFIEFENLLIPRPLNYLNVRCNDIRSIAEWSFEDFNDLKILDISYNQIFVIDLDNTFSGLYNLRVLNLQYNLTFLLTTRSLLPLRSLEILNLTRNRIHKYVLEYLQFLPNLRRFYCPHNSLESLEDNLTERIVDTHHFLEVMDLQYNYIDEISVSFFRSMKYLKYLYLNNNLIRYLSHSHFEELFYLSYLDLSCNEIILLDNNLFSKLFNLATLKISNNKISFLPNNIFDNNTDLTLLDLSSNRIQEMPLKIFQFNTQLSHLYLTDNQMIRIADDLFTYSKFQCVNLTYNSFTNFKELVLPMRMCLDCLYVLDDDIISSPGHLVLLRLLKYVAQSK